MEASESLDSYLELSTYKSCIKNYKKPILPPLITSFQKEELKQYRAEAVLVENKIKDKKADLKKIVGTAIELFQAFQNEQPVLKEDNLPINNSELSDQNKISNDISEQVFNPETLPGEDSNHTEQCKESAISASSSNFRPGIHYEEVVAESDDSSGNVSSSRTVLESGVCKNLLASFSSVQTIPSIKHNTWIEKDSKCVEATPVETEFFSSSRLRSDCDSLSDYRSTDLDKYLDSSFDYAHFSETSSEKKSLTPKTESTETLIDSSQNTTPNSQEKKLNESSQISFVQVNSNTNLLSCVEDHRSDVLKPTWLKKVLDTAQHLAKTEIKDDNKNSSKNRQRHHVRSKSYTLDSPSPVLMKSLAGCSCRLPSCPNCSSLKTISPDLKRNANTSSSNSVFQNETNNEGSSSVEVNKNNTKQPSPEGHNPQSDYFNKVYQDFIKLRDQAISNLKEEHTRQWKELLNDFREKEDFIQGSRLHSPITPPARGINISSINSPPKVPSSASVSTNQPNAISTFSLSNMRSLLDDDVFTNLRGEDIQDFEMKKKFDKISAAAKGYLTRRLLHTKLVQSLIQSITNYLMDLYRMSSLIKQRGRFMKDEQTSCAELKLKVQNSYAKLHDIFFKLNKKEQMRIIAGNRELLKEEQEIKDTQRKIAENAPAPVLPCVHISEKNYTTLLPANIRLSKPKQKSWSSVHKTTKHLQGYKTEISSFPDLSVSKKPMYLKHGERRRILSPRSCTISPPSHKTRTKFRPLKKDESLTKTRRTLY